MKKQVNIRIYGIVQGVGFRPFVSRLASQLRLCGTVCNKGSFVEIVAQGGEEELRQFLTRLQTDAPPRALIMKQSVSQQPQTEMFEEFSIIASTPRAGDVFVSPDLAVCPTCRRELYDPTNRRYLHPFINCTDCGPRLTILKQLPYDRERTTMSGFAMCPACAAEYETVGDRRYDAQPVCCPSCGPQVYVMGEPDVRGAQAIHRARAVLRSGGIVAVKGIGGFHLCCDAGNRQAVELLRARKQRRTRPFAVMTGSLAAAEQICELTQEARSLLDSPQKPIVLCKKRMTDAAKRLCDMETVAPKQPTLGVMLPYAPLQLLLFDDPSDPVQTPFPQVLVMTSGNCGGAPICQNDAQAAEQLLPLCELILSHDREILMRADDSVVDLTGAKPQFIRRSRGYAPLPVAVSAPLKGQVLAVGGELKNTFCIGKDAYFYLSPHVGDLSDVRAETALEETSRRLSELLEAKPAVAACDLHPDYHSSHYAQSLGLPVVCVQHHYAHVLSCMAENDALDGRVLGVAFDGTGYGTDGSVWGGEFLLCDTQGFQRRGSLMPFVQSGGDAAAREGWRIAVSLLLRMYDSARAAQLAQTLGLCSAQNVQVLAAAQAAGIGTVTSTSAGRLFDAASALLGIEKKSTYEGEAAQALQNAAQRLIPRDAARQEEALLRLRETADGFVLEDTRLWERLIQERLAGGGTDASAYLFHEALAAGVEQGCLWSRARDGVNTVALTGGCFCNRLLTQLVKTRLERQGFRVLTHSLVPANDGGLALGQAVAAMCGQHT